MVAFPPNQHHPKGKRERARERERESERRYTQSHLSFEETKVLSLAIFNLLTVGSIIKYTTLLWRTSTFVNRSSFHETTFTKSEGR